MNKTLSRVLWIIAGVLLIVAGVYCFVSPDAALSGLSLILGLAMLFSGIVDIVIFASSRRFMLGSGWFLLDGIFTVLLAIFLLCNQAFTMLSLPFIFGMWLLFGGISRFVSSFDLQRLGVRGWGWFTVLGILLTAAGILRSMIPFPVLWPSVGSLDWCLSCRVSHLLHRPASPGASGETLFYKTTITSSIIFKNDRGFGSGLFAHLRTCMQLAFLL